MRLSKKTNAQRDRGTVLLTTLLIMTVMAAITIALMEDIRISVKRTLNVHAYAQADWQAAGAEDFVTAYLENDFAQLPPVGQIALLQSRTPIVLPTPSGAITLTLKDASHCFNLNSVVRNSIGVTQTSEDEGVEDNAGDDATQGATSTAAAELEFVELATLLGLPNNQAVALSNVLKDWQDADQQQSPNGAEDGTYLRKIPPYRTSDTAMRGPEEMRALHGMDEDLWQLFKPFVCTGEAGFRPSVNVNSLTAERVHILAAALSGEKSGRDVWAAAETILRDRPLTGYESQERLLEALSATGIEGLNVSRVSIETTSIFVEVVTQVGPAERVRSYRYDGVDASPRLTYRGWGRETFRPEIESAIQAEQDAP